MPVLWLSTAITFLVLPLLSVCLTTGAWQAQVIGTLLQQPTSHATLAEMKLPRACV